MPTGSEPLNPCPCLPDTVPRLRPWLEKYFFQLELPRRTTSCTLGAMPGLPGCMRATNTNYWGECCHPCGGTGEVGRGKLGERKEGRDELRAPRE